MKHLQVITHTTHYNQNYTGYDKSNTRQKATVDILVVETSGS